MPLTWPLRGSGRWLACLLLPAGYCWLAALAGSGGWLACLLLPVGYRWLAGWSWLAADGSRHAGLAGWLASWAGWLGSRILSREIGGGKLPGSGALMKQSLMHP